MQSGQLQRREFITLLGGATAWPLAVRAQQPAMPVIGLLSAGSPGPFAGRLRAFLQGLQEAGYVEGRNVRIEYRWAEDHYDRLPALAADLVRRQVVVIVTAGGPVTALAAKAATATIPIVFVSGDDPVRYGLVASLNRPGGNVTGAVFFGVGLVAKQLELLRQLVPSTSVAGYLVNPNNNEAELEIKEAQAAAGAFGLTLGALRASNVDEIEAVFPELARAARRGAGGGPRSVPVRLSRSADCASGSGSDAGRRLRARVCRGRRPRQLWHQHRRCASPGRRLCGPDS